MFIVHRFNFFHLHLHSYITVCLFICYLGPHIHAVKIPISLNYILGYLPLQGPWRDNAFGTRGKF